MIATKRIAGLAVISIFALLTSVLTRAQNPALWRGEQQGSDNLVPE